MNTTRRETGGPVKVNLEFHEATIAVVCQEGCYPDKKAHVNQDCFACKPLFHEEGDAAKQMLIGVFDGHGPNGEHCASIAAHAFPDVLRRLRSDSSFASHGARDEEAFRAFCAWKRASWSSGGALAAPRRHHVSLQFK